MDDIVFHQQQLEKARREGNLRAQAIHLGAIGNLRGASGDIGGGLQSLQEALQAHLSTGEYDRAATTCRNIAAHYELGLDDLETAMKYIELGVQLAESDFNKERLSMQLKGMRERLGLE